MRGRADPTPCLCRRTSFYSFYAYGTGTRRRSNACDNSLSSSPAPYPHLPTSPPLPLPPSPPLPRSPLVVHGGTDALALPFPLSSSLLLSQICRYVSPR